MFRATFSDYKPCFLNYEEIMNPFKVLRNTFQDASSAESIIDECWDIWTVAFRSDYWTTYESPRVLYERFLKLARLLDAGWLVSQIRPSYLTKGKVIKPGYNPKKTDDSNRFKGELIEAFRTMGKFYNESSRFDLVFDLYGVFYQGLMPTSWDFEIFLKESAYFSFQKINQLILALYVVCNAKEEAISEKDKPRLAEFTNAGLDHNTPQFDYYDCIDNIFESFNKTQFFSIVEYLKNISSEHCYWKYNGNPANVLYYMEELQFVMEILWSFAKEFNEKDSREWKIPKKAKKQIKHLPNHALKNPLKFVSQEFEKRSLSERRKDIEEWRLATLDNKWHNYDTYRDIQNFLLRMIEIADLLEYQPTNY
ncbi:hypothetical protein [Sphingobacterium tabacisoli]|uniref:Uncharacterized protein n=1 Tax=Sphingobacterium tabacisoli TaxID=2044855 RepID=A0ABW5L236_9SPHI|nr:hypothetical protein [Sphingobacterium tabacisoli]